MWHSTQNTENAPEIAPVAPTTATTVAKPVVEVPATAVETTPAETGVAVNKVSPTSRRIIKSTAAVRSDTTSLAPPLSGSSGTTGGVPLSSSPSPSSSSLLLSTTTTPQMHTLALTSAVSTPVLSHSHPSHQLSPVQAHPPPLSVISPPTLTNIDSSLENSIRQFTKSEKFARKVKPIVKATMTPGRQSYRFPSESGLTVHDARQWRMTIAQDDAASQNPFWASRWMRVFGVTPRLDDSLLKVPWIKVETAGKTGPETEQNFPIHRKETYQTMRDEQNRLWALDSYRTGQVFSNNGQSDEALKAFTDALQIDAKCVDAYIGRSKELTSKMRFQQAIKDLKTALSLEPTRSDAQKLLAELTFRVESQELLLPTDEMLMETILAQQSESTGGKRDEIGNNDGNNNSNSNKKRKKKKNDRERQRERERERERDRDRDHRDRDRNRGAKRDREGENDRRSRDRTLTESNRRNRDQRDYSRSMSPISKSRSRSRSRSHSPSHDHNSRHHKRDEYRPSKSLASTSTRQGGRSSPHRSRSRTLSKTRSVSRERYSKSGGRTYKSRNGQENDTENSDDRKGAQEGAKETDTALDFNATGARKDHRRSNSPTGSMDAVPKGPKNLGLEDFMSSAHKRGNNGERNQDQDRDRDRGRKRSRSRSQDTSNSKRAEERAKSDRGRDRVRVPRSKSRSRSNSAGNRNRRQNGSGRQNESFGRDAANNNNRSSRTNNDNNSGRRDESNRPRAGQSDMRSRSRSPLQSLRNNKNNINNNSSKRSSQVSGVNSVPVNTESRRMQQRFAGSASLSPKRRRLGTRSKSRSRSRSKSVGRSKSPRGTRRSAALSNDRSESPSKARKDGVDSRGITEGKDDKDARSIKQEIRQSPNVEAAQRTETAKNHHQAAARPVDIDTSTSATTPMTTTGEQASESIGIRKRVPLSPQHMPPSSGGGGNKARDNRRQSGHGDHYSGRTNNNANHSCTGFRNRRSDIGNPNHSSSSNKKKNSGSRGRSLSGSRSPSKSRSRSRSRSPFSRRHYSSSSRRKDSLERPRKGGSGSVNIKRSSDGSRSFHGGLRSESKDEKAGNSKREKDSIKDSQDFQEKMSASSKLKHDTLMETA